ncbi:hypothetical protein [Elizabethkingia meningoseptica]|uniref:hypothetical protein n=1 Tax=Elizabethkingia meningoseptica TaxID=238 RepID=UPI000841DA9B|nr:hypothetical protein [Elizabethkingia meningoseptica]ODM55401.1 hypothetical protein BES09_02845 [Elizabethkingia meningoseptica]OHT30608.1 hypothetical protein BFF93_02850 [Elizabethkingia meningoseptica]OPC15638.1 hypothetical protein BAX93_00955 [Elizabethkingia meningoseptica]
MNTQTLKIPRISILFFTVLFWTFSCRNADQAVEGNNNEAGIVYINLIGAASETQVPEKATSNNQQTSDNRSFKKIIPFDAITSAVVTLTPENTVPQASKNGIPMGLSQSTALENGIKYKVVVYNENGMYEGENNYTVGDKNPAPFKLNGGQTYTFIAYSIGSKTVIPAFTNGGPGSNISGAKLTGINGDLMFYKKKMTVSGNGSNNLDIILKHRFSQINTKLDARQVGFFGELTNPLLIPQKALSNSADINFATDELVYNGSISGNIPLTFPAINPSSRPNVMASNPVQLISSGTTGDFYMGNLVLDGIAKENLIFDNVKITPGLKYNMNVRFQPCRQDTRWTFAELGNQGELSGSPVYSRTLTMPASDLGFVFEIYDLDNSFNMKINGTMLATKEIQFESAAGIRTPQNVMFADGTKYQSNGIPGIWTLSTVWPNPPIVRVVIDKNGNISMFGLKSNGGSLQPLILYDNNKFNKITWYGDKENEVIISQEQFGSQTRMKSSSSGRKIVKCID